jgi:RNA-directed DNA polymerase
LRKAKHGIKKITRWSRGVSLLQVVKELNTFLRGWLGYFKLIETPTIIRDLDSWIRRRLRCYVMKQWIKNSNTRYQRLRSLGVSAQGAGSVATSRKGPGHCERQAAKSGTVELRRACFSSSTITY